MIFRAVFSHDFCNLTWDLAQPKLIAAAAGAAWFPKVSVF
jgi:hypothetical protein